MGKIKSYYFDQLQEGYEPSEKEISDSSKMPRQEGKTTGFCYQYLHKKSPNSKALRYFSKPTGKG